MAGGAPIPIPVADSGMTILSIADLKDVASKKLPKSARGNHKYVSFGSNLLCVAVRKVSGALRLRPCLEQGMKLLNRRYPKV